MSNSKQFYYLQRTILIIALMLILFSDTADKGIFSFINQPQSIFFYPQLVVALMAVAGPNLLMMVLGAQQLQRPALTIPKLMQKLLWLIAGIVLFSVVYYGETIILSHDQGFNVSGFFKDLVQAPVGFYDVLYEVLGFFVSLPVLRIIAKYASEQIKRYLFWTELIFIGMLPIITFFTGLTTIAVKPPLAVAAGCFFALMGYWLSKQVVLRQITREHLLVAWLLTFCCYAVMVSVTMYQVNLEQNVNLIMNQPFAQTLQAIPCMTLWVTVATQIMNRKQLKPPHKHNWLQASYGSLLVAGVLFTPLKLVTTWFISVVGIWWYSLALCAVVLLLSVGLVQLLRRLPVMQRLLPDLFGNPETVGVAHATANTMD
ncbi:polysaccharide biosynthesis protein [Lactiplantibacillus herbarum]|uniref:polysaccharide biosynthesis protein n=1 Tax=Lactiplantibacillus herbarum TaxID=1670446 RepID=UPI000AA7A16F|nr:polysaccharide biosynthesis protein [Lactiplantibacillus herbarum]